MPDSFTAVFTNERTKEVRTFTFTLQQYRQARLWMTLPVTESATELVLWLNESNEKRQAAYCAVKVWQEELSKKGAH